EVRPGGAREISGSKQADSRIVRVHPEGNRRRGNLIDPRETGLGERTSQTDAVRAPRPGQGIAEVPERRVANGSCSAGRRAGDARRVYAEVKASLIGERSGKLIAIDIRREVGASAGHANAGFIDHCRGQGRTQRQRGRKDVFDPATEVRETWELRVVGVEDV